MRGHDADWTRDTPLILTSSCLRCGHRWYISRQRCPRCGGSVIERRPSAPVGSVVAVTSVSPQISLDGMQMGLTLVDLDDGIRIMARCAPGLAVGARVRWFFPEHRPGRDPEPGTQAGPGSSRHSGDSLVPHVRLAE